MFFALTPSMIWRIGKIYDVLDQFSSKTILILSENFLDFGFYAVE